MRRKNYISLFFSLDKHQELDLPSQVHVEEDEAVVEEEDEEVERAMAATPGKHDQDDKILEHTLSKTSSSSSSGGLLASNSASSLKGAAGVQPRLMQKISAKKEVTEETLLAGNDVPPFGVKTENMNELERVSFSSS